MSDNPQWEIIQGDALKVLSGFAPGTFDAVITDPPYASGGRTQAEKNKSTAKKYSNMGDHAPPPFDGDAKDQRSWTRWAAEWLYDARKICKPGAPVCMFIDWRQLPAATDALQWAGWIWRGTAVWDKGNSRPQKGRFRQQAEYIVWGSNGDMPISRPVPCLPGVFKYGNPQNRFWRVMAACLSVPVPPNEGDPLASGEPATLDASIAAKRSMLLNGGVALWDVIESCDIKGSSDASIRNVVPAHIERITGAAPIEQVICNGGTAGRLYKRYLQERTGLPAIVLPSTSPANAAWRLERLVERWNGAADWRASSI